MANNPSTACGSTESAIADTLQRINADWRLLAHDVRAAAQIEAWAVEHPAEFPDARTPADVVDRFQALWKADDWAGHDAALGALLRLISEGSASESDLAGRIAVRVMLPRTIKIANSQLRPGWQWDETFSIVLSALFEVVRTYPLQRRPRQVYANISLDTLALARRVLAADGINERQDVYGVLTTTVADAALLPALPDEQYELVDVLVRAAELQLLVDDDAEHMASPARTARLELLELVVWAVEAGALSRDQAQTIAGYYRGTPERRPVTTRAMGADGARIRKRANRAVSALRNADLNAFLEAA